jgi:hypothetical protein
MGGGGALWLVGGGAVERGKKTKKDRPYICFVFMRL